MRFIAALLLSLSTAICLAQATTGLPAPVLNGTGAPLTATPIAYLCKQDINNVQYIDITPGLTGGRNWVCLWNYSTSTYYWYQLVSPIQGTSVSIGGALLALGLTTSGTGSVPNAVVGSNCIATPSDGSTVLNVNIYCTIATAGVATVTLQAYIAGTPPAKTYNVRVIQ